MRRKRCFLRVTASILACLLLGSLFSCKKLDVVKVGFSASLTGFNSELGVSGLYGAQVAVDTINSNGGILNKQIELIVLDDKSSPEQALENDHILADSGCDIVVGHMTSDLAKTVIPFFNDQKKLLISPTMALASLEGIDDFLINDQKKLLISPTMALASLEGIDDFLIRLIPSTDAQASMIAQGIEAIGAYDLLIVSSSYNKVFAESLSKRLAVELDNTKTSVAFYPSFDFRSTEQAEQAIEHIASSKPDCIVLICAADDAARFAQMMRISDVKAAVFLPAWAMTSDLLQHGGESVEGFYGVNYIDYASNTPQYLEFRGKFFVKFGSEPNFASILTYESIMLLAQAMEQALSTDAVVIKNQIITTGSFNGLQSELVINKFGDITRPTYLYQILGGSYVKLEEG